MIKLLTKSRDRKRKHEARERLTHGTEDGKHYTRADCLGPRGCSKDRTLITHDRSSLWYSGTIWGICAHVHVLLRGGGGFRAGISIGSHGVLEVFVFRV